MRVLSLRQIGEDGVRLATTLNNNRNSEFCAPLTSFDWNDSDPRRLGTSRYGECCLVT